MNLDQYLASIRNDSDRLATCSEQGDLGASVAACPGWDVRELVMHTGGVHRWATHAIRHSAPPERASITMPTDDASGVELAAWLRSGASSLTELLADTPPDAETWHPFPFEQKASFWSRRQAQETMMHRWDGEVATTGSSDLDAAMAADGIHEFFELSLPRVLGREQVATPAPSLHVHCTDDDLAAGAGEWLVWNEDGEYRMEAVHRKGDAALRGRAEDLLLVLTGRADRAVLDVVGDEAAAAAWLDLPGL